MVQRKLNNPQNLSISAVYKTNLSQESRSAASKFNTGLKFLYRKNKFLSPQLRQLLCNVLTQPHSDYPCSAWYSNLNKTIKVTNSSKKMCTFLLWKIGFLLIRDLENVLLQTYLNFAIKDFFDKSCISKASTRNSTKKLSQPLRRSRFGQNCISFLAPSVWSNLPNELKFSTNLNTFKHKIKELFFYKIRKKDKDKYFYD